MKIIALISFTLFLSSIPLKAQQVETDSSAAESADAALEAELAEMLLGQGDKEEPVRPPIMQLPTTSAGGFSNMNPNIGLIT